MPEIEVPHPPVAKARPRIGKGGRLYTPSGTAIAEARIREAWIAAGFGKLDGPAYMEVHVRVARPSGHFGKKGLLPSAPRWPAVRPDLDNYAKTALDALLGVAFQDDGQIVQLFLAKHYADDDGHAGWTIGVFPMQGEEP